MAVLRLWMYARQYMEDFLFNCWIWSMDDTFLADLRQLFTLEMSAGCLLCGSV